MVDVSMKLDDKQAGLLRKALEEQLYLQVQELWYADEFRYVQEPLRFRSILATRPQLAAVNKALVAVRIAIRLQSTTEQAR